MEPYPDSTPTLWFEPPLTTNRRRAPPIDPVFLIILIPILAILFLFLLIPPFLSHTSHILKPGSVKSTWDSVNIFLVLFAIICGVMSRKNDDVSSHDNVNDSFVVTEDSNSNNSGQFPGQWVGFPDPKMVSDRFIRRTISDPVSRHEYVHENVENRNRFYDDFYLDLYSNRSAMFSGGDLRLSEENQVQFVKEIPVDTFVVKSNVSEFEEQQAETLPSPSPPVAAAVDSAPSSNSKRHSFRSVAKNANVEVSTDIESDDSDKVKSDPSSPSTALIVYRSDRKQKTLERKVSDVATAITSLYNQRKSKKKRKSKRISDNSLQSPKTEQSWPPPPPPPPPPPSVFQNLFKKGNKHKKRIHSVPSTIPPPPPPPPPRSILNNIFKSGTKSKRFHSHSPDPPASIINTLFKNGTKSKRFDYLTPPPRFDPPIRRSTSSSKPPLPTKTISYYERERDDVLSLNSGSQSPLVPVPPPPPPFKVPAMKFEVRGDFVKVRSAHSSVCSSPDHDANATDGDDSIGLGLGSCSGCGLLCCPSPDVDAKADSFISRLKDEWRKEKMR